MRDRSYGNAGQKKALVVDSGIAGPVAAMALQRAGIGTTVYEAYDRPAERGYS